MDFFKKKKTNNRLLVNPEAISQSFWMMKLINKFMLQGKKFRIEKIILSGFYELRHSYIDIQPFFILFRYLILHRPMFGFNKVRLSRLFKTIPVPLSSKRQMILILTWFIQAIRVLKTGNLKQRFYQELKNIRMKQKSALVKYKPVYEFYFQIVSNRVNVRFRWK